LGEKKTHGKKKRFGSSGGLGNADKKKSWSSGTELAGKKIKIEGEKTIHQRGKQRRVWRGVLKSYRKRNRGGRREWGL